MNGLAGFVRFSMHRIAQSLGGGLRWEADAVARDYIGLAFQAALSRDPSERERMNLAKARPLRLLYGLLNSREHLQAVLAGVPDLHAYLLHGARVRLVATQLPRGEVIMDLGGANGNLYEMGYPHSFERLIVVDLPPEDRHELYRHLALKPQKTDQGDIVAVLANMTDLSSFDSDSADLVWSGQSVEHITEEESFRLYNDIRRVLKPSGSFCLDTPNRLVTEIHVEGNGWINPDHKIEYTPEHLQRNLRNAGFAIEQALGVCEMVNTCASGTFDYRDFLAGAGITTNVDSSYVQYYRCRK